jgi:hypothetical protein
MRKLALFYHHQFYDIMDFANIILFLAIIAAFGIGFWVNRWFNGSKTKSSENAAVLLERIKNVCKLITVEGYFSEVYDYTDYWGYDLPGFRKKALIRVKARVSAGFDMSKVKIDTDSVQKIVRISNVPEPTILAIDHDLDYYDISQSSFNRFKAEDYTRLNKKAKDSIADKANESELLQSAKLQGNKMLEVVRTMGESMGWRVEIEGRRHPLSVLN